MENEPWVITWYSLLQSDQSTNTCNTTCQHNKLCTWLVNFSFKESNTNNKMHVFVC